MLAVGQGESGLQVAQGESPADWTVDVDTTGLGNRFALAYVKPHKLLHRVETVRLQYILYLWVRRFLKLINSLHHERNKENDFLENYSVCVLACTKPPQKQQQQKKSLQLL